MIWVRGGRYRGLPDRHREVRIDQQLPLAHKGGAGRISVMPRLQPMHWCDGVLTVVGDKRCTPMTRVRSRRGHSGLGPSHIARFHTYDLTYRMFPCHRQQPTTIWQGVGPSHHASIPSDRLPWMCGCSNLILIKAFVVGTREYCTNALSSRKYRSEGNISP